MPSETTTIPGVINWPLVAIEQPRRLQNITAALRENRACAEPKTSASVLAICMDAG